MFNRLLIVVAFISLSSFAGNKNDLPSGKAPITEFFFFELRPVNSQFPYYFSQSIAIEYNDSTDLRRQMRMYFHELKAEVALDKLDTLQYKGFIPMGSDTRDHCDAQRIQAESDLSDDTKSVINVKIHE